MLLQAPGKKEGSLSASAACNNGSERSTTPCRVLRSGKRVPAVGSTKKSTRSKQSAPDSEATSSQVEDLL